ncbi:urease accessory protein UreF [Paenibacillus polymyxa]|uniref:urease accessory protein UreF n=1 Tax=Paenibacillus polymyxa TaxID=1406 RepID=UPI00042F39BC|nr:urease accessory UreF family protein [Paenibacillus polymyxa]AHM64953.1 urease accessory protein UreF [Paenibacillus polymyxa SQR-21]AIY10557.1 urease accessory protein UreF [Paenibacillus polymyxa]
MLNYALLLDPSLPIGGFTRFYGLEERFRAGHLNSLQDLKHYMRDDWYPQITTLDGMAIKSLYAAIQQNDGWRIALIDKMLHAQHPSLQHVKESRLSGQRLLKLTKALYPWLAFDQLEDTLTQYNAIGTLATVHTWINSLLGSDIEQTIHGYFATAVSFCIEDAFRLLNPPYEEKIPLIDHMTSELLTTWKKINKPTPSSYQRHLFHSHRTSSYITQPPYMSHSSQLNASRPFSSSVLFKHLPASL